MLSNATAGSAVVKAANGDAAAARQDGAPGTEPRGTTRRPTVTLLVPTMNEIEGMRQIMPRIPREWVDQIIIADAGSKDGTIEYAREHGYDVVIQKKRGLIEAYRDAYPLVRGEVIILFSPDGNSVPEVIPELVAKMIEGYDMVIASRYLGNKQSEDDDFMSRLGNWLFTRLINVAFGGRWTDALVIYRAFRTELVEELGLLAPRKGSFEATCERLSSWEFLLSMRTLKKRKYRVTEIFGPEPPRVGGVSRVPKYEYALFDMGLIFEDFLFRYCPPRLRTNRVSGSRRSPLLTDLADHRPPLEPTPSAKTGRTRRTVTLLVPTINECEGMKQMMPRIKKEWVDQVLVVDKNSTDGTVEYARAQGYDVVQQKQRGLVNAYREAFDRVRGEILITFSPDGNSLPEMIPPLVQKIEDGFDMVIVSRYLGGAKSDDDDFMSKIGNWIFTTVINTLFSANYTDALVMYRGYRTSLIRELGMLHPKKGSFEALSPPLSSWEVLSSIRAPKYRKKVGEILGIEPARVAGDSRVPKYKHAAFAFGQIAEEFLFQRRVPPNV